ncbi:response regulator [Novosphingobium album (ex Liu et al. 2023)]|uniref:Response regulator n=1 Tax=Novosphingobium album (ex Liu et al. 2023) TaxID=3031130 RepID=A0ABT5WVU3_9SPHN|nr:response regulator [Novosphingobium album (ex Liu et al. 2023)]MDE8654030.1 response regulator [Novosphingobium album (ex Liu et al. 2023)]
MTDDKVDVLVIDDDDITAEMVERALMKVPGEFRVIAARDGVAGLEKLLGRADASVDRPNIILLDLNMPRMNGFEFLEAVRGSPELRDSVIFVLTTSDVETDRSSAYSWHVAGYMVKSSIGPKFAGLARLLGEYSSAVDLPV